jgi:hypothetical protein
MRQTAKNLKDVEKIYFESKNLTNLDKEGIADSKSADIPRS